MLSHVSSFGLSGIEGYPVTVEVDISQGLPGYEMVGLPDAAVRESRERVRSAIRNVGYQYPPSRIVVNLAPAHIRKEGPLYDLPIALGILAASEQVPLYGMEHTLVLGELALNGDLRWITGVLPMVISAREQGILRVILPRANAQEVVCIEGIEILAPQTLGELIRHLKAEEPLMPVPHVTYGKELLPSSGEGSDFMYVKGQQVAKRAMEIAAAGGHNILLSGPPGSGKTMLARALPSILPDMTFEEALESTKLHSIMGLLPSGSGILNERPFRAPHHSASAVAMVGGGSAVHPGEVSMAHNGVLFLDELPEFPRAVLETLRGPLEDGCITVSRVSSSITYPARFMLVAAMNPCPCGFAGMDKCHCSPHEIQRYLNRISGPLLDRIDMHVGVDGVSYEDLEAAQLGESSAVIKQRVDRARAVQLERYARSDPQEEEDDFPTVRTPAATHRAFSNAQLPGRLLDEYCALDEAAHEMLGKIAQRMQLSARTIGRIRKVARTIADMDQAARIGQTHLAEAIQYRVQDVFGSGSRR